MFEDQILPFFIKFAYQPWIVYGSILSMMYASSFGLPVPEEVTLISAGLVCYIASTTPPPYLGAVSVNLYITAGVAFFAVFSSDILVYSLGKFFGRKFLASRFMSKYKTSMDKVTSWVEKYGHWAGGLFRFTPGLRFPGHLSCGMMGVPLWKFILVDGSAALFSVPTQVILVASFGGTIIKSIKKFQTIIIGVLVVAAIGYYWIILFKKNKKKKLANSVES